MTEPSRRSSLLIIFLVVFIDLLGFGIVLPLLPRYAREFNASAPVLGLLMSAFSAMQFLFAPLWGRVSDRIGRRPILLVGLAGSAVFYTLFGYISSLGAEGKLMGLGVIAWLFITRIGQGIAGATIPTAQAYIADSTTTTGRGKGMALIGAAFGLGFTFGPLMAIPFVGSGPHYVPSGGPGYLAGGLSLVAFLAAIALLPESLPPGGRPTDRHWLDTGSVRMAMKRPLIVPVLLTIFLTTFAFAEFESTLALVTLALHLDDRWNYVVFAYLGFTLMICQGMIVRRLIPRIGEFKTAMAGAVLLTIGLLCVGAVSYAGVRAASAGTPVDAGTARLILLALAACLPVAVLGFSFLNPSLQSLLSLNTPDDEQGQVLGLGQSLSALARIGGPFIGISISRYGIHWPQLSAAAVMLLGAVFVSQLRKHAGAAPDAVGTQPVES